MNEMIIEQWDKKKTYIYNVHSYNTTYIKLYTEWEEEVITLIPKHKIYINWAIKYSRWFNIRDWIVKRFRDSIGTQTLEKIKDDMKHFNPWLVAKKYNTSIYIVKELTKEKS